MNRKVIVSDQSYTFADYFKLNPDIDDLLAYFGYSFEQSRYSLPHATVNPEAVEELRERLENSIPYFNLTSETARREILIAPVLIELARQTHSRIKIEYTLNVSDQLQGIVDYLILGKKNFLIVEAKNEDLQRGFTQLAVEMIALSQSKDTTSEILFGAVSIGSVWKFGVLHRSQKLITQDIGSYRVPEDLTELLGILSGILNDE